jgi:NAD-dependent oxidoreductase involved in siderophore biosynthesis
MKQSKRKPPRVVLPVDVRLAREREARLRAQARRAYRIPGVLASGSRSRKLAKRLGKFKRPKKVR